MAEFAVKLSTLDDTVKDVRFPIKPAWLSSVLDGTDVRAPEGSSGGTLELRLYRSGSDIIISGTANAKLMVDCSRCLEDVAIDVAADVQVVMSEPPTDAEASKDELELSSDELGREYYTGDELILDDIVRDHLLLELPMQPVCVDPPCPEWVKQYLTTAEEADAQAEERPPDPRLAALQSLKDKLKPKA
jgi:uncharacterized protein